MKAIANTTGTWTLRFADGSRITAATAAGALAKWQRVQWHSTTRRVWRAELAKRAYVWSGTVVDSNLPASKFLEDLETAGLIQIERGF